MTRNHLSRIAAPKHWMIKRKQNKWVTKPLPGPHAIKLCLPLDLIISGVLGLAKSAREIKYILNNGGVLVDKVIRKERKFPVGLMDVLEIPKLDKHYRLGYDKQGQFKFIEIDSKESSLKLLKVKRKVKISGDGIQVGFHDGRSMILEKNDLSVGDSVVFDLEKKKIVKNLYFGKDALVLLTGGKHAGIFGRVKQIIPGTKLTKQQCIVECDGKDIKTLKEYVFVVGKDKLELKLEEIK